jgi:pilus assembly protein CpaD
MTMPVSRTTAALLVLGLAAGCTPAGHHLGPASNPSLSSVHQPIVQRSEYALDLQAGGGGIPAADLGRLGAWFESLQLGYGDRIYVDEPAGYGSSSARADIGRVAGQYGLLLSPGAPVTAGFVQPGTVRVVVSRSVAVVPGCPNWGHFDTGAGTMTSTNYGCAVNSNLSAMIANPNDLVLGRPGAVAVDAATASKAIRTYRDAPTTGSKGLPETVTTGGN